MILPVWKTSFSHVYSQKQSLFLNAIWCPCPARFRLAWFTCINTFFKVWEHWAQHLGENMKNNNKNQLPVLNWAAERQTPGLFFPIMLLGLVEFEDEMYSHKKKIILLAPSWSILLFSPLKHNIYCLFLITENNSCSMPKIPKKTENKNL